MLCAECRMWGIGSDSAQSLVLDSRWLTAKGPWHCHTPTFGLNLSEVPYPTEPTINATSTTFPAYSLCHTPVGDMLLLSSVCAKNLAWISTQSTSSCLRHSNGPPEVQHSPCRNIPTWALPCKAGHYQPQPCTLPVSTAHIRTCTWLHFCSVLPGREPGAAPEVTQLGEERSTELSALVNNFILRR